MDEKGYPPTQEYFLYSDEQVTTTGYKHEHTLYKFLLTQNAYLSHCPNRFPDFQQLIHLDEIPTPLQFNSTSSDKDEKSVLYQVEHFNLLHFHTSII